MSRATLPATDRLLTSTEAGERLHMGRSDFVSLASVEPILLAARRYRGTRAYWMESGVVRFMHYGMAGCPERVATGKGEADDAA